MSGILLDMSNKVPTPPLPLDGEYRGITRVMGKVMGKWFGKMRVKISLRWRGEVRVNPLSGLGQRGGRIGDYGKMICSI